MRFVLFYHSLVSDWNHTGAHFLRGVASELIAAGHSVRIFEPADGWSLHNLREQAGEGLVKAFHATYPRLRVSFYDPIALDLDEALADAEVVIAHEWNEAGFLRHLGEHRVRNGTYRLLFHDSPHRPPHDPLGFRSRTLAGFDGVLAASEALRELHERHDWVARGWTWHDAVDTRIFRQSAPEAIRSLDLIWVGSWGSGERVSELNEFLIEPVRALRLRARFYGARYPQEALRALRAAGIDYGGWIADFSIPAALSTSRFSVHVPTKLRADGFPTQTPAIRVLQALACGVPVVSAPWDGCAELFTPDVDLLIGRDAQQIERHLLALRSDPEFARVVAARGLHTVTSRHTCAHRAQELLSICEQLGVGEDGRSRPARRAEAGDAGGYSHPHAPNPAHPTRSRTPAAWS